MLNCEDFDILVPASEFLGQKLREISEMNMVHAQKREQMRLFCEQNGIIFVELNEDCTFLYTRFKTRDTSGKIDIELKNPGLQISIKEDEPENTI